MWQITQEQWQQGKMRAKDIAYGVLFLVVLAFFAVGALSSPVNMGLIGAGMGLLAVIGIGKA